MSFVADLIHRPRRLFLRRALFQIHLWAGVLLSLYIAVIALTGAVLVFEDEFTAITLPSGFNRFDPAHIAPIPQITARFQAEFPTATLSELTVPSAAIPAFQLTAADQAGLAFGVAADPQTGELTRTPRTWVEWIRDLHVYLLLPHTYGAQLNGAGAAVLLLLSLTGLALWWPGLRHWARGLRVNLRANWRRINFDLHNAIGFWTLAIVLWWAFSGFYFGFYRQVAAAVNFVSPLRNMVSPKPLPTSQAAERLSLTELLEAAQTASPAGHLYGLSDPLLKGHGVYAYMDLGRPGDFSRRDIVLLDTTTGQVLSLWHYADKHSPGDWILWSMHPLHFGTLWGLPVKIVWAVAGTGLAVVSVTGLLMYWNRYLRHRWRVLRAVK